MGERGRRSLASLSHAALPRWLAAHPHVVAASVFAAFVLLYLWPVLVGGRILSPLTIQYGVDPWKHLVPDGAHDHFNTVLFDVPTADYPWRWLVRSLLHDGTFPAWNPHVFAGAPLFANPQTGLFSLFSLPLWALSLNYGIGVGAALKLWAGGFGAYLLVRELQLGLLPGLLAGVCFSFSALNIVWLTHETLPAVVVMLPWVVWLVERIHRGGRLGCVLGLAAVTAIALGGGHPGAQVHVLAAAAVYAVLRAGFGTDASGTERLRGLGLALGGLALGTLVMAFMLIPEALSSRGTIGLSARRNGGSLPGSEMPFTTIRTVAFPDWWGRPSAFEVTGAASSLPNYNERTFYAGAIGLVFAAMALLGRGGWRAKAPFVVLGAIGLAVPLHAPGLYWLATHLPVLEDVQSQRMHFLFAFAVAVLAAFGLHGLLERPRGERLRPLAVLAALAVAGVGFAQAGGQPGDAGRVLRHFLTGIDIADAGVAAMTSVGWFALFAFATGVALLVAWRWPGRRRAVAAAVVLLAVADAYHFAHGYQPMTPAEFVPPVTPAIAHLQRHAGSERLIGLGTVLVGDLATTYGLSDVRGYDPPQPTERFHRLWQLAEPEQNVWKPFLIESLDADRLRVVSVLGGRWIVFPPEAVAPEEPVLRAEDRALRPLRRAYLGADAAIFRNPNAAPRAAIPSSVVITGSEPETLDELAAARFDPRRTAVVERDQPGADRLPALPARGRVAIVEDRNARVTMRATLERPGLVVLNDNWSAGWSVRVDGEPAPLLHVNEVMRGVVVERGRHEIVWSYAVPGLRLGAVVSTATLSLMLIAGLAGPLQTAVRRRRSARIPAARR